MSAKTVSDDTDFETLTTELLESEFLIVVAQREISRKRISPAKQWADWLAGELGDRASVWFITAQQASELNDRPGREYSVRWEHYRVFTNRLPFDLAHRFERFVPRLPTNKKDRTYERELEKILRFHSGELEPPAAIRETKIQSTKETVELVRILEDRRLRVDDVTQAEVHLLRIGYHRFKGYFKPFLRSPGDQGNLGRQFAHGTRFDDVLNFYRWDRELRSVLLKTILELEVQFRATLINVVSGIDGLGYLDLKILDEQNFHEVLATGVSESPSIEELDRGGSQYGQFLSDALTEFNKRHALFADIGNFREKYIGDPAAWLLLEHASFEQNLKMLRFLSETLVTEIFQELINFRFIDDELPSKEQAHLALTVLKNLRNFCAHGEHIWDFDSNTRRSSLESWYPQDSYFDVIELFATTKEIESELFTAILAVAYFLSDEDLLEEYLDHVMGLLEELEELLPIQSREKWVGIPDNWRQHSNFEGA
jgi:abortive infection bacteriophage resistance protein